MLHVEERGHRSGGRARGRQRPVGEDERVERLPEIAREHAEEALSEHALDPQAGVGFGQPGVNLLAAHQGSDPGLELLIGQRACERSRWRPPRKPPDNLGARGGQDEDWHTSALRVSRMKRQRSRLEASRHVPVENQQGQGRPRRRALRAWSRRR